MELLLNDKGEINNAFGKFKSATHDGRYQEALQIFRDHGDEGYVKYLLEFIESDGMIINEYEQTVGEDIFEKVKFNSAIKMEKRISGKVKTDDELEDFFINNDYANGTGNISRHGMHEIDICNREMVISRKSYFKQPE